MQIAQISIELCDLCRCAAEMSESEVTASDTQHHITVGEQLMLDATINTALQIQGLKTAVLRLICSFSITTIARATYGPPKRF